MSARSIARGTIAGVVTAVPARVITNADCPDPQAAEEAAKLTGVRERRWVREDTAADLCRSAARRLLEGLGWRGVDLDLIVYVTQMPERAVPADVFTLAADLGASSKCVCLQVNWSCSGYVYGLWTAMRLLDPGKRALLVVGDATSRICDPGDRATAPLFGDAGSATAIFGEGLTQHFVLGSDGDGAGRLSQRPRGFLKMDGAAVFNFTLRVVPPLVDAVLEVGRPDYLLFHQANAFMLEHLAKKSKLQDFEPRQIPTNVARFGNTSCASIPLLMCDKLADQLRTETASLGLFGFGAGWAWAGAHINTWPMKVVELVEV